MEYQQSFNRAQAIRRAAMVAKIAAYVCEQPNGITSTQIEQQLRMTRVVRKYLFAAKAAGLIVPVSGGPRSFWCDPAKADHVRAMLQQETKGRRAQAKAGVKARPSDGSQVYHWPAEVTSVGPRDPASYAIAAALHRWGASA